MSDKKLLIFGRSPMEGGCYAKYDGKPVSMPNIFINTEGPYMTQITDGYTYKTFKYTSTEDQEEDCTKIYHSVVVELPGARELLFYFDWSPYSRPTVEEFQMWIDLGLPGRVGSFPLNHTDLVEMAMKMNKESV